MPWTPPALHRPLPELLAEARAATTAEEAAQVLLTAIVDEARSAADADGAELLRARLWGSGSGDGGTAAAWDWARARRGPFVLHVGADRVLAAAAETSVVGPPPPTDGATHIYGLPLRRDDGPPRAIAALELRAPERVGAPLTLWRRRSEALTLLVDALAPWVLPPQDAPFEAVRRAAERWLDAIEDGRGPAEALAWRHSRSVLRSALLVAAKRRWGLSEGLRRLGEERRVRQNNHSRALAEAQADLAEFGARLRGERDDDDRPMQGS